MSTTPSPNLHASRQEQKRTSLGVLRGRVVLTIQTHPAQRLIHGRRSRDGVPAIWGLIGFAERLKTVWQGAREDDPYAHWWLLKVDQSIKQARALIADSHQALQRLLEQDCVLDVSVATSLQPQRVELQFANPYAFLGAQMLAEFDRLICTQLTLNHIGLVLAPAQEQGIKAVERKLRSTFLIPQGYHFFGIDRAAVEQGTATAQRAVARMGSVPTPVLTGELRALLAPKRPGSSAQRSDTVLSTPIAHPKSDLAPSIPGTVDTAIDSVRTYHRDDALDQNDDGACQD